MTTSSDLQYKRSRALEWLANRLNQSPTIGEADLELDALVRKLASLPSGAPYGFVSPRKNDYVLLKNIPFWPQTDNYTQPDRTCFSSTGAMFVKHFKPQSINSDDEYLKKVLAIGDTTDPNVQIRVLKSYGIDPIYSQKLDFADLDRELDNGKPIMIAILHRGPSYAPFGGHWFIVVGRTADRQAYICNDPYGSIGDGYTGPVSAGYNVQYSRNMLKARWTVEGKNTGWGIYHK